MAMGTVQKGPLLWLGLIVLVIFFGLCTAFAAVATAAQAWEEHIQARWPLATAHVEECGLERTSSNGRRKMHIRCRLEYAVGGEHHATNIYSGNVAAPEVWQYPPNQIAPLEEWVNRHSPGTPIAVSYDPADGSKIVLVATDMPRSGPHTANNMKLLEICAGTFLVLLVLARMTWPRTFWENRYSSLPADS
jgi:hypothetical protein